MADSAGLSDLIPTARSRVRRHPERAHYDRTTIYAILDAALLCHLGYVIDGKPYVTPTLFWRNGDRLYWHGSSASRMLRTQRTGIPVCVTVSHIDGLVLARSAFRHSLNYRAVMLFGTAAMVDDDAEKEAGLNAFIEHLYPGRTKLMRAILPQELKATSLMSMAIEEASAKIRDNGPLDLEADYDSDCWAGTIPIVQRLGAPVPDARVPPRGSADREVGHFAEGAAFDRVLLSLAREGVVIDKSPASLTLAAARAFWTEFKWRPCAAWSHRSASFPKASWRRIRVPRTASRHAESCFTLSKAPVKRCFRLDHRKIQANRLSLK